MPLDRALARRGHRFGPAARLYVGLRWLGDRPYWTNLDTSDYDFRALCATGRRLGLIA